MISVGDLNKDIKKEENKITRAKKVSDKKAADYWEIRKAELITQVLTWLKDNTEKEIKKQARKCARNSRENGYEKKQVNLYPIDSDSLYSIIGDDAFKPFIKELEDGGYKVKIIREYTYEYYDSESTSKSDFYYARFEVSWE
jgi:hypothetical protein